MSDTTPGNSTADQAETKPRTSNWGPAVFLFTLACVLVFFWWLVIYSGGVEVHHG